MNARERAKTKAAQIYDQYWSDVSRRPASNKDPLPDIRPLLEQALIEFEEAGAKREREACAEIADREYVSIQTVTMSDGRPEEGEGECCAERCLIIRNRIRARSEGENRDKCIMLGCEKPVASPEPFARYCQDHALPEGEKKGK